MRRYMIEYRIKNGISIKQMAKRCRCTKYLLEMLEQCDYEITHPNIAKRIAKAYNLNQEQYESMIPKMREWRELT